MLPSRKHERGPISPRAHPWTIELVELTVDKHDLSVHDWKKISGETSTKPQRAYKLAVYNNAEYHVYPKQSESRESERYPHPDGSRRCLQVLDVLGT